MDFPKTLFLGIFLHGEIPLIAGEEGQLEEERAKQLAEFKKQKEFYSTLAKSRRHAKLASVKPEFGSLARQERAEARAELSSPISIETPSDLIPEIKPLPIHQFMSLNAVTCGVSNVSNITTFNQVGSLIKDFIKTISHVLPSTLTEWEQYINTLRGMLIYKNEDIRKKIELELKKLKDVPESERIKRIQDFIYSQDTSYNLNTYKKDDDIINKKFSKLTTDEMNDEEILEQQEIVSKLKELKTLLETRPESGGNKSARPQNRRPVPVFTTAAGIRNGYFAGPGGKRKTKRKSKTFKYKSKKYKH
jgi:hypothetical protein